MTFAGLAYAQLSVKILVAPIDGAPAADRPPAPSALGLPLAAPPQPPADKHKANAPVPAGTAGIYAGHFRVLAVDDLYLCDQVVVVYLFAYLDPAKPICDEPMVYSLLIPTTFIMPYAELAYGSSALETYGGCSGSGSADVSGSYDRRSKTVSITFAIDAKLKCFGKVVAKGSASITISKNLGDLTPCVDFDATSGPLGIRGKLCLEGDKICAEDMEAYITYKGKSYVFANPGEYCVPLPAEAPTKMVPCTCD